MMRPGLLAVAALLLGAAVSTAADEAKGDKVEYDVYTGYFESNKSGLKGDSSYLFFSDEAGFGKVFLPTPPTAAKKPVLLPQGAFEKKAVVAVVKRGNAITEYEVEKVTNDKGTLYLQYKTKTGTAGTAMFASPLIVSVPKEKYTSVVFTENGKTAETLKVADK
jgi:hypothetical protein